MLCRRRKTALVPLSLAALVKVVAASECTSRISVEQSCWDNFAPCYLLWGVAVVYAIWSCMRVEWGVREAKNAGEVGAARARWEKAKKCSGSLGHNKSNDVAVTHTRHHRFNQLSISHAVS